MQRIAVIAIGVGGVTAYLHIGLAEWFGLLIGAFIITDLISGLRSGRRF